MTDEKGQYNKKRLLALGVLVLLIVIILLLLWWWFIPKGSVAPVVSTPVEQPQEKVVLPLQKQTIAQPVPKPETPTAGETEVMNLARNFAERYGSWSTDSKFQNLVDLFPSVTAKLQREFQRTIDTAVVPTGFKGVVTKALQVTINSLSASAASVSVMTQRVERDSQLVQTDRFQGLDLTMVKQGNFWYVDSALWK